MQLIENFVENGQQAACGDFARGRLNAPKDPVSDNFGAYLI
jgi:hypothetical protein